jgi:hypothetical protein
MEVGMDVADIIEEGLKGMGDIRFGGESMDLDVV